MEQATATAVDWNTAPMMRSAANTKAEGKRVQVIRVPRAVMGKYWPLSWSELEQAGARGDDGLSLWIVMTNDLPPTNFAHLREGRSDDGKLRGMSLLFQQGWTAETPASAVGA